MADRALALRRWLLLAPVAALYGALLAVPLVLILTRSLEGGTGGYEAVIDDPVFRRAVENTVVISVLTTVISLAVATVLAVALWRAGPIARALLLALILLPFWTSVLVKNFAWAILLNDHGIVNDAITGLGLRDRPLALLHNRFAVVVGMVHYLVPYAVLPIYAVLRAVDARLELAASSLGAGRWQFTRHVLLPLIRPGLYAAGLLVFIIATGFFITPVLLGGPGDALVANQVEYYARTLVDFRAAAVAGVFVTLAVSLLVVLYQRLPKEAQYGTG